MTKTEIKTVAKFVGMKDYPGKINDWNFVMIVVEKIGGIIEHEIKIGNAIEISWWYSSKKTGTFGRGAGGGGGGTVKRTPFESIFGKLHTIYVYYQPGRTFKVKPNEQAESKIQATVLACYRWIKWYNKTVKPKK